MTLFNNTKKGETFMEISNEIISEIIHQQIQIRFAFSMLNNG